MIKYTDEWQALGQRNLKTQKCTLCFSGCKISKGGDDWAHLLCNRTTDYLGAFIFLNYSFFQSRLSPPSHFHDSGVFPSSIRDNVSVNE